MENSLNEMQKNRLRQENESTQGILRVVGFDWIYERAKFTFDNIVNFGYYRDAYNNISNDIC